MEVRKSWRWPGREDMAVRDSRKRGQVSKRLALALWITGGDESLVVQGVRRGLNQTIQRHRSSNSTLGAKGRRGYDETKCHPYYKDPSRARILPALYTYVMMEDRVRNKFRLHMLWRSALKVDPFFCHRNDSG